MQDSDDKWICPKPKGQAERGLPSIVDVHIVHIFFTYFEIWVTPSSALGLPLALCLGLIPGGGQKTIRSAGD